MDNLKIFFKRLFLVVIVSTGIARITCSGNILIVITWLLDHVPFFTDNAIFFLWLTEIWVAIIWSIWTFFSKQRHEKNYYELEGDLLWSQLSAL